MPPSERPGARRTSTVPALLGAWAVALALAGCSSSAASGAHGGTSAPATTATSARSGSCAATALVDGELYHRVGDGTSLDGDALAFTVGEQIGTATVPTGCADAGATADGTTVTQAAPEGAAGLVFEVDGVDPAEVVAIGGTADPTGAAAGLYVHADDDGGTTMSDTAAEFVSSARGG